jgi:O-antigen ligase
MTSALLSQIEARPTDVCGQEQRIFRTATLSTTTPHQDEWDQDVAFQPSAAETDEGAAAAKSPVLLALAAAVLGGTLILGGAGDEYPLITAGIELAALILLWYIAASRGLTRWSGSRIFPHLLIGAVIALPLIQLVPIAPELWRSMPGRELAWKLLSLSGLTSSWRPLSLDPAATIATALEMLPGLAMFFAAVHLSSRNRLRLVYVAISAGFLSVLLGALQKAGGDLSPFILFDTPHRGNSPGFFVNRNHQATFLLLSMLLTAGAARAVIAERPAVRELARIVAAGLVLIFAAGVLLTNSRTGFLLLVPAIVASLLIIFPVSLGWKATAASLALGLGLVAVTAQSEAVQSTLERFSDLEEDERTIYWQDTMRAAAQSWPVGTGIGTFPKVYATVQSVETVGIQYVNNAHNDYLELVLEGGIAAFILILVGLFYLLLCAIGLWRHPGGIGETALASAALAAIVIVLLHSAVDFPLRLPAIMSLFGLLWGLVAAVQRGRRGSAAE